MKIKRNYKSLITFLTSKLVTVNGWGQLGSLFQWKNPLATERNSDDIISKKSTCSYTLKLNWLLFILRHININMTKSSNICSLRWYLTALHVPNSFQTPKIIIIKQKQNRQNFYVIPRELTLTGVSWQLVSFAVQISHKVFLVVDTFLCMMVIFATWIIHKVIHTFSYILTGKANRICKLFCEPNQSKFLVFRSVSGFIKLNEVFWQAKRGISSWISCIIDLNQESRIIIINKNKLFFLYIFLPIYWLYNIYLSCLHILQRITKELIISRRGEQRRNYFFFFSWKTRMQTNLTKSKSNELIQSHIVSWGNVDIWPMWPLFEIFFFFFFFKCFFLKKAF